MHSDCRYLNNPREALQHLNAARRHVKWSTPALMAMAEIYLNPASDVNWATDSEADVAPQPDGDTRESLQAAGTLLKQLKASDMQSSKYKVGGGTVSGNPCSLYEAAMTITHDPEGSA